MEKFDKALRPFGESVRIDETQGEAWGNIATCYIQMKKMKEAYSTLEQAVKHAEGNWKIWSNLLSVSLSLKQFYKFF
jgi:Flp pilus assembly protein TadD